MVKAAHALTDLSGIGRIAQITREPEPQMRVDDGPAAPERLVSVSKRPRAPVLYRQKMQRQRLCLAGQIHMFIPVQSDDIA